MKMFRELISLLYKVCGLTPSIGFDKMTELSIDVDLKKIYRILVFIDLRFQKRSKKPPLSRIRSQRERQRES